MTTPTEAAMFNGAAYMRARRAHTVSLYFRSQAEKENFQAQAAAMGYPKNFNAWLLQEGPALAGNEPVTITKASQRA